MLVGGFTCYERELVALSARLQSALHASPLTPCQHGCLPLVLLSCVLANTLNLVSILPTAICLFALVRVSKYEGSCACRMMMSCICWGKPLLGLAIRVSCCRGTGTCSIRTLWLSSEAMMPCCKSTTRARSSTGLQRIALQACRSVLQHA